MPVTWKLHLLTTTTATHSLLARLFDDQPQALALISAYDGTVEYANRGTYAAPDNVVAIRADTYVGTCVYETMKAQGFPEDHPTLLALRDGQLHVGPSLMKGHWAVSSVLPSDEAPQLRMVLSSAYEVCSQEEAVARHQRDVSRAMMALEFDSVRSQLTQIGNAVLIAQRSADSVVQHMDVMRWAVQREG